MILRPIDQFVCNEDYPVISTTEGKYRGTLEGNVFCYRGIPYGKVRRFHRALPADQFEGVHGAYNYGPVEPGMSYRFGGRASEDDLWTKRYHWYRDEDCLNLNVWTPSISQNDKKPIMVWLHGGGYAVGNALDLYSYDGWEMSHNYDVVVVTVNHRLNMCGFMDLSKYGEQYKNTGILGMLDLVDALKWIRKNAAAFGGDPENITIYGQSGGGGKVITLLQMPEADGLYHKAIIQSGVFPSGAYGNPSAALADIIIRQLDIDPNDISALETMDYEALTSAIYKAGRSGGIASWSPVPDGEAYIGDPLDVGFRKETANVPLIVGTCFSELGQLLQGCKAEWSAEKKEELLRKAFGNNAPAVRAAFENAYPEVDVTYATVVDFMLRSATLDFLNKRNAMTATPAFNYIFGYELPLMGGQMSCHNGDLHFMFHNALFIPALFKPGITGPLQDAMAGAWAAFAHTGSPNGDKLPAWDAYDEQGKACMFYSDQPILKKNHDGALIDAITKTRARPGV